MLPIASRPAGASDKTMRTRDFLRSIISHHDRDTCVGWRVMAAAPFSDHDRDILPTTAGRTGGRTGDPDTWTDPARPAAVERIV